jgi:hypothetical protein
MRVSAGVPLEWPVRPYDLYANATEPGIEHAVWVLTKALEPKSQVLSFALARSEVMGICGRIAVVFGAAACVPSAELRVQPEYLRKAPDGKIVAADRDADGHSRPSAFIGGRLGYASFQVIAKRIAPGE